MNISIASPWIFMDKKKWMPFIEQKFPISVQKNTSLFYQNDNSGQLYIVRSGRIRITMFQQDGTEKQLYIAEEGALFGERSCLLQTTHATSAIAIVDSLVYIVPFAEAIKKIEADFELALSFIQLQARKNSLLIQQVAELSFLACIQRIAQVLLNLAEAYGEPVEEGVLIQLRFTHQDVANLINASRVTVSNAFNLLLSRGIITRKDSNIVVANKESLRSMAMGEDSDF